MDIKTEHVTLAVSDGTSMRAYVARPVGSAAGPGLMVFQEAFGVNAHIREVTERFAKLGYVAIAPELFHRSGQGVEISYDEVPAAMAQIAQLTVSGMEADERTAYDWLRANGAEGETPIGAVGFCMGGRAAFIAALTLPVKCAVSFYGGGVAPGPRGPGLLDRASELQAPVLFFYGGQDKNVGPAQAAAVSDALRAAGKSFVQVEFSEAGHAFFCDARASYNSAASAQAWPLTLAFLSTYLSA